MQGVKLADQIKTKLEELANQKPKIKLEAVLLAVSGGRDSMALLHLMLETGLPFSVAHLDHGIRGDSSLDADFVRETCAKLQVQFFSERVNIPQIAVKRGWSLEEAARKIRYEFLSRIAKKTNSSAILTAHHLEDNAETVLMQLLRGTARAIGIPARRGLILRPLLELSKSDLEKFLLERGLAWHEDSSNTDPTYTRNWVRLEVMPKLLERYPKAAESLARYGTLAREEDAFLEELTAKIPTWANLALEPKVLQRRQIRHQLEDAGLNVDFTHVEEIRSKLENPVVTRVSLPQNHIGVIQNGKLEIPNVDDMRKGRVNTVLTLKRTYLDPKDAPDGLGRFGHGRRFTPTKDQNMDFSSFPNAIQRTRASGDKIQLSGGTRKLSDVLIDKKIPRETRDSIPLVAQGSEVLFIGLEPPILDVRIGVTRDLEIETMKQALELALEALEAGEVPVGAVILHKGEVVGTGRNRSLEFSDMTRHAELEAIRNASQKLETPYLTECTLVVTLEPCLMCLGAILEARVKRVVFGASSSKNGALGGVMDATRADWSHQFEVRTGVLEKQSSDLLTRFFIETRASKKV
jgi:tRNA(Ile)-lysidine synthase